MILLLLKISEIDAGNSGWVFDLFCFKADARKHQELYNLEKQLNLSGQKNRTSKSQRCWQNHEEGGPWPRSAQPELGCSSLPAWHEMGGASSAGVKSP